MKKLTLINWVIISMFFIFSAIEAFSQTDFYYSRGEKIPLIVSSDAVVIKFKDVDTDYAVNAIITLETTIQNIKPLSLAADRRFFKANLKSQTDLNRLIDRLKGKKEVEMVNYVYMVEGLEAVPYDQFSVQFKPSVNREQVEALNKLHNVEIIKMNVSVPNLFRLRITETSDLSVVDMAKLYYESLPAEWSVPDFFMPVQLYAPNDTYFTNQYYLHNTGQTGGVTDADIDALEAWNFSTGSSSITVAVIDEGGSSHEDLPANRIVAGYDYCYFDNNPSPGGNQAHGMACAGVIAATQNNSLGVTGVAPNCKVMPVRIFDDYGFGASHANIATAIDFAWLNGADVLSNSWGYRSSNPNLWPDIVDAINRALTQGRNGKGCVVVFAAGNYANRSSGYYAYVSFPACVPGVIAVGATDKSNNIQNYSPRDAELAVVAPSGGLGYGQGWFDCSGENHYRIELRGDVWSMDIGGQPGWNDGQYGICPPTNYNEFVWQSPGGDAYPPGNYTSHFGGTSAACPQASGIASLILSLNPDLTQTQVANIIKQTADDMGATGWDNDFGWGRINAHSALLYLPPAAPTGLTITNAGQIGEMVQLGWNANTEPDLDHYNVWRKCKYGVYFIDCNLQVIASTTSTSYTDSEVFIAENDGRTDLFTYYVTAVDATNHESAKSTGVSTWGSSFEKRVVEATNLPLPEAYSLEANHPNPFNPTTTIKYDLPEVSLVSLVIYNLMGQEVIRWENSYENAGFKQISWNGIDGQGNRVPAGVYLYRLAAKSNDSDQLFVETRKMLLLK